MSERGGDVTPAELDALWRPSAGFVGPSLPPMLAWLANGCPKDAWQVRAETMRSAPSSDDLPLFVAAIERESEADDDAPLFAEVSA